MMGGYRVWLWFFKRENFIFELLTHSKVASVDKKNFALEPDVIIGIFDVP